MRTIYDSWSPVPPPAPLDRDLACDVAIVGAGVSGLSLAYELASRGRQVTVLEAEHAGFGASGRNGGILFPAPGLVWLIPGALPRDEATWAFDALRSRCSELAHELGSLEGGPTATSMYLAAPSRLINRALPWVTRSLPGARRCSGEELAAHTGQRARGAVVLPAHTVDPKRFTRALLSRARAAGAAVHEDTPVTDVVESSNGVTVTARGYRVRAGEVVVASGAWAARRAFQTWMLASPPLPESTLALLGQSIVATAERSFTYRRVQNGRLLFGAFDDPVKAPLNHVPADVGPRLTRLLRRSIPELPPFEPECVWGGAIHSRAHELPLVRRESPHVVRVGAIAGIYWALVGAELARGLLDPSGETPEDRRLRQCVASTRVPWMGALGLALRLMLCPNGGDAS